jgi:hypothetical protein
MGIIATVPGPVIVEERDPGCEMCRHQYFTPHLHRDGTGRCFGRSGRNIYIQATVDGMLTCTCANGQHSEGRRPRCWHVDVYETLLRQTDRPQSQRRSKLTLEDLF